jgi:hypothetical protein
LYFSDKGQVSRPKKFTYSLFFMKNNMAKTISAILFGGGVLLALSAGAQTYNPANWVVDPFSGNNPNFSVSGGTGSNPTYTDNGSSLGSLYGNSPIGATLSLVNPGDSITLSGQVELNGNVNNSNLQLRFGLLNDNGSSGDTGWLGYLVAFPNASGQNVLYLRNNPNTGVFGSGTGATTEGGAGSSFSGSVVPGTNDFSMTITLDNATSDTITWNVANVAGTYSFSGSYTDTSVSTEGGLTFDQVGFLAGGSTWTSASTFDQIAFNDVAVEFTPVPEPTTLALGGLGALCLMLRRRRV